MRRGAGAACCHAAVSCAGPPCCSSPAPRKASLLTRRRAAARARQRAVACGCEHVSATVCDALPACAGACARPLRIRSRPGRAAAALRLRLRCWRAIGLHAAGRGSRCPHNLSCGGTGWGRRRRGTPTWPTACGRSQEGGREGQAPAGGARSRSHDACPQMDMPSMHGRLRTHAAAGFLGVAPLYRPGHPRGAPAAGIVANGLAPCSAPGRRRGRCQRWLRRKEGG